MSFLFFWRCSQVLRYGFTSSTILYQQNFSYIFSCINFLPRYDAIALTLGLSPNTPWASCRMSCGLSFFNTTRHFFIIRKVSIYNRKVFVCSPEIWFLPLSHKSIRFIQDMFYFSHNFLISLYRHVSHQTLFQEIIFKKRFFFSNIWDWTFELKYNCLVIWENFVTGKISPLFIFFI